MRTQRLVLSVSKTLKAILNAFAKYQKYKLMPFVVFMFAFFECIFFFQYFSKVQLSLIKLSMKVFYWLTVHIITWFGFTDGWCTPSVMCLRLFLGHNV